MNETFKREENIIHNILDEFFNNYPKSLRNKIEGKFFIAGGAISSIISGEKVNDYDIYFTDVDALNSFILHVTKEHEHNEFGMVWRPNKVYRDNNCPSGMVVITDMSGNPINIRNAEYFDKDYMSLQGLNSSTMGTARGDDYFLSENAISFSNGIQVIFRFVGEPEDVVLKNFDFAHCTGYMRHKCDKGLVLPNEMIRANVAKKLIVRGTKYPIDSLQRMKKYISRGYAMEVTELFKLVFAINDLNLRELSILRDQLIGIDASYLKEFIEVLDERIKNGETTSNHTIVDAIGEIYNQQFIEKRGKI